MTRAQGPAFGIEYRSAGALAAPRCVLVVRSGAIATTDPAPLVTAEHHVRLLLIAVDEPELDDPPTFGGETPAGSTAAEVLALLREEVPDGPVGVVGERAAALFAVALAAALGDRADRLALVGVPLPETGLARDLVSDALARVAADTLVVNDSADEAAPEDAARWYAERLPHARADVLSREAAGALDGRLGLTAVWPRVLAHVAPDTRH
ncbi:MULTISPECIES: hypothetical protein [Microbacterium]|uniref:Alpha/beta hydrolase n=1 Tax=Microbacterium wangchenii TaxID=2541726 RepID=A0ABX5STC6_9MICO|nr:MULTISPECIES: hypothetical protein [Microbacterium]MCK6067673.1 hypothetical protein [Microbacterium sp. EYE_512]QBR89411.1 hypothetical protein E4K62_12415 [Microbacterium wangchenii]TFV81524.1 hypothetical protein E4V99_11030 [Microbacterium sp. dk485]TXK11084.1 hypothetical protein FVP99_17485 [Microbacterium wangchenii]